MVTEEPINQQDNSPRAWAYTPMEKYQENLKGKNGPLVMFIAYSLNLLPIIFLLNGGFSNISSHIVRTIVVSIIMGGILAVLLLVFYFTGWKNGEKVEFFTTIFLTICFPLYPATYFVEKYYSENYTVKSEYSIIYSG